MSPTFCEVTISLESNNVEQFKKVISRRYPKQKIVEINNSLNIEFEMMYLPLIQLTYDIECKTINLAFQYNIEGIEEAISILEEVFDIHNSSLINLEVICIINNDELQLINVDYSILYNAALDFKCKYDDSLYSIYYVKQTNEDQSVLGVKTIESPINTTINIDNIRENVKVLVDVISKLLIGGE